MDFNFQKNNIFCGKHRTQNWLFECAFKENPFRGYNITPFVHNINECVCVYARIGG